MSSQRTYSRQTRQAAVLLGELIRLGRKQKGWSEKNLAERAGIARATLQKIENGDPGCALGLAFEVATLVDIKLFQSDLLALDNQIMTAQEKITLLPKRIRPVVTEVFDDF